MDFSPILNQLVTIDQANDLIIELDRLAETVYLRTNKFGSSLKKIDGRYYQPLVRLLETEDKRECLKKIIAAIKAIPMMNISLSFYPSYGLVEEVSDWLEEALGTKVLVTVKKKQELLTKIELEYQGKYIKC